MRAPFRIGRLFGIGVSVDPSWFLLFALLIWNLTSVFRKWHPGWTLGQSIGLAILASLLFFASVLTHEFAHALVAQRSNVVVEEIRLFLFGGIAGFDREPPSAGAEFWIAIAGPLTSYALGLLFMVGASALVGDVGGTPGADALSRLGPGATLLLWLSAINFAVGTFNLLPGYPLDGGRIFHAALWRVTGDLPRATRAATVAGQAVGGGLITLGILMAFGARIPFFGGGAASGLWLVFIGWFLSDAAGQSYRTMLILRALEGVRVNHLMRRSANAIAVDTSLDDAVGRWFLRSDDRALPVFDREYFVGMLGISDVRKVPRAAWASTAVAEVMTPRSAITPVDPAEPAAAALRRFAEHDVDELPVVSGGELVGLLTRSDIARWIELYIGTPEGPQIMAPGSS